MFAWSKLPLGLEGPGSGIGIQVMAFFRFFPLCCFFPTPEYILTDLCRCPGGFTYPTVSIRYTRTMESMELDGKISRQRRDTGVLRVHG